MLVLRALHHLHDQRSGLLHSLGRACHLDLARVGGLVPRVHLEGSALLPDLDDRLRLLPDDLAQKRLGHRHKLFHCRLQEDGHVLGRGLLPPLGGFNSPFATPIPTAAALHSPARVPAILHSPARTAAILPVCRARPLPRPARAAGPAHLLVRPGPHLPALHGASGTSRHRRPHVALPAPVPDLLPPIHITGTRGRRRGGRPPSLLLLLLALPPVILAKKGLGP
mmetsp:Transcript_60847/g.188671  ORF Transcript_60847/g.188671 Transcript_60847/m.188671 type:complete len:224 (-) Transcript_60847:224-895(-)